MPVISDLDLQRDVLAELDWEPALNAAHIGVTARNGVVTLTGHVQSYAEKMLAERATRRVRGVRAIAENITVELPAAKKTADDEIAARAIKILEWDVLVPSTGVEVKVEQGIVTLAGEVDWHFQKDEAERDVRRLTGVRDVVNTILVRPHATPANIEERIKRALERSADLEAGHIHVSVRDGIATLRGAVGAWIERESAERAARAAPGVMMVNNEITLSRP